MAFCPTCGAEVNEKAVICVKCGVALNGKAPVQSGEVSDKEGYQHFCCACSWATQAFTAFTQAIQALALYNYSHQVAAAFGL